MASRAIAGLCALSVGLAFSAFARPAPAQAPQHAAPAPEADATPDPGVLFWAPERREAAFRAMYTLTPHRVAPRGGPISDLQKGPALALDPAAFMTAEKTAGVLVLQHGRVRLERYGLGLDPHDRWVSFSMTKSLVSTLVGAALKDGLIQNLDDPVTRYAPDLAGGGYDGVTLRQLLTMTSGVAWNEDYEDPNSDVSRFLTAPADPGVDPTISYMRRLPRAHPPGTVWNYSTGETNLVGAVLAQAINAQAMKAGGGHRTLSDYLSEKIWIPAGMDRDAVWMLDAGGHEVGGCCVSATLRDWGRVGQMALNEGRIGDARIVPDDWFAQATTKQADIGAPGQGYGYLWWTYDDGRFRAAGIFGQTLFVDPSRDLVVVILSAWPTAVGPERSAARTAFLAQVQAAVDAAPQE